MKNNILTVILSSVCFLSIVNPTLAGRIDVINENKKPLDIRIQAEGDSIRENLATYVEEIPAEYFFTFQVDPLDLKGKSHYSINGETNPFTMGGTCQHLSVDKDYKVTFLNNTVGTTCISEELK